MTTHAPTNTARASGTEGLERTAERLDALELLLRHDGAAPRYTSYPPATFFTADPRPIADGLIEASNRAGGPFSLYFHIPFCPRRCLFCGCHTEVGQPGQLIRDYMSVLPQEFRMLAERLDRRREISQIHVGGGTPNSVPMDALEDLLALVQGAFRLADDAEVALECDPSLTSPAQLERLRAMGFNRVSFGIQDTNLKVLEAVNRRPPRMALDQLVGTARALGFTGINLDLICGLPLQTRESFHRAVADVAAAGPDRISLFPYAHVPWIKGHQTALEPLPFPGTLDRLRMTLDARALLAEAGYEAIGMDHFARPDDELAMAKRAGTLRRNFQGYAPPRAGQVHALGASAISQLDAGYLQNEKDIARYMERVRAGELPFIGGYRMRPEDGAARDVINALLCRGEANLDNLLGGRAVAPEWVEAYRDESLDRLTDFAADGLVDVRGGPVRITEQGFPLSRRIAAAFDPLAAKAANGGTAAPRYSRVI